MTAAERFFNLVLGVSILSWAALSLLATSEPLPIAVRLAIAAVHLCVGVLVIVRAPARKHGSLVSSLASLPALLTAGWAMMLSPNAWSTPAQWIFCGGGGLAIVSFLYLGVSFSILPAVRGIVTTGPFRLIRHPAYFGELLMIAGCGLAAGGVAGMIPFMAAIPLVGARILVEERILSTDADYSEYMRQVRWRLAPYLW